MKDDTINNTTPAEEPAIAKKPKKEHRHSPLFVVLTIVFGLGLAALAVINVLIQTNESRNCKVSSSVNKYTGGDEDDKDDEDKPNNNNDEPSDDTKYGKITLKIEAKTKFVDLGGDADQYYNETFFMVGTNWYYNNGDRDAIIIEIDDGTFDGRVFPKDVSKSFKVGGTLTQIMIAHFGNGGNEAVLMLREDGTVATIRCDNEYGFVYQDKLDGLNNIKAIYEGGDEGGGDAFAVDANGKAHSLILHIWPELAN